MSDDEVAAVADGLVSEAQGDDERLLRLATARLGDQRRLRDAVESLRDAAALRLRESGVPMVRIARWAGVSDSYLTRRLLRMGAHRLISR